MSKKRLTLDQLEVKSFTPSEASINQGGQQLNANGQGGDELTFTVTVTIGTVIGVPIGYTISVLLDCDKYPTEEEGCKKDDNKD